jgi:predicted nuclease of predicted toxin-antitoxin system
LKLLLDQGVPRRAAALLREAGHDAVHASEVGLSSADDREVVRWCLANGATVVTLDADFHTLIALSGERTPSAIRIRAEGLGAPAVARLLVDVIEAHGEALAAGALLTLRPGRLRLRRLPITRRP